jgi:hypothetical protein
MRAPSGEPTVLTGEGPLAIEVPRDREGTFEPGLIAKHERCLTGFDDKILAHYARGMTGREIQVFLGEMYAVEVSPDSIGTVTDSVVGEVTAWQSRPLEPLYPLVFFDAPRVKIRDDVHPIRHSLDLRIGRGASRWRPPCARSTRRRSGCLRARPVEHDTSDGGRLVAPRMVARHSVLLRFPPDPARDLHDERARLRPRAAPKDHQDPWPFSER